MRGGHPIVVIVLAQVLIAVLAHHGDKALVIAVRTRDAARLDIADPHLLDTLVVMLVATVVLLAAHAHGSDHGTQALAPLCAVLQAKSRNTSPPTSTSSTAGCSDRPSRLAVARAIGAKVHG